MNFCPETNLRRTKLRMSWQQVSLEIDKVAVCPLDMFALALRLLDVARRAV